MIRAFAFAILTVFALGLTASTPARAASDAETFVQQQINAGLGILNDSSLSDSQRRDKFRGFILTLTDMKRIALFTLGPYRRGASDADLNAFVTAFTSYANAVYEVHLAKYKGQTMKVTGSTQRAANDTIVNAQVTDPSVKQPINAAFRVLNDGGHFSVVDVQVEGIWLAIDQRDQFSAFLQRNGGNLHLLTDYLNKQGEVILSGGASEKQ